MPELRRDPTSGAWVSIASERSRRPSDFHVPQGEQKAGVCPFCYGNEHMTPPEVLALGRKGDAPNREGWSVRVVPNKFPAFSRDGGDLGDLESGDEAEAIYAARSAVGVHEVLVESPDHDSTFGTHPQGQMEDVLAAVVLRLQALSHDSRLKCLQVFKNWGRVGGASLAHSHCQLIATPMIPIAVELELGHAERWYGKTGRCLYCEIVANERVGTRIVDESRHFLVFCPYASRFPYETWIVPKGHCEAFEKTSQEELSDLARILRQTVRRFELAFDHLPYNLVWHTSPWNGDFGAYYHWHLELLPRLAIIAGFELGTGYYINPTAPEVAAAALREYEPDDMDFRQEGEAATAALSPPGSGFLQHERGREEGVSRQ